MLIITNININSISYTIHMYITQWYTSVNLRYLRNGESSIITNFADIHVIGKFEYVIWWFLKDLKPGRMGKMEVSGKKVKKEQWPSV